MYHSLHFDFPHVHGPTDYFLQTTLPQPQPWPYHFPGHKCSLASPFPTNQCLHTSVPFCTSLPWHVLSQSQVQIIAAFQSLSQTPPPPWPPPPPYDVICNSCPGGASGKNVGDLREVGSVSGWGRSPGEGNGNLPQYLCLENPMGRGA